MRQTNLKRPSLLIVLLIISSSLSLPVPYGAAESSDPIDPVLTDPYTKVNATYARGATYSTTVLEDGQFMFSSEPAYVFDGSRYVPYVFEDLGGYYRVQSGLIGAEIHRGKAVFYDPYLTYKTVGRETWLVYQLMDGSWVPVCASLQRYYTGSSVSLEDESVTVNGVWETAKGTLEVSYLFKQNLKHTITWTPTNPGKYSIVQFWNETNYSDVRLGDNTVIRRNDGDVILGSSDSLLFTFYEEGMPFGVIEDQFSARDILHKVLFAKGTIEYQGISITDGVAWVFYNASQSSVGAGESIVIDPITSTLNNPTIDGYIYWTGVAYVNAAGGTTMPIGKTAHPRTYRSYAEWDISGLPADATITDSDFQYHGESNAVDGHIHAMLTVRPSTGADADIYAEMANDTEYANVAGFPVVGATQIIDLGPVADGDIQDQMAYDWFAIGIMSDNEGIQQTSAIYAEEQGGVDPAPTLRIIYTIPPPTITSAAISDLDDTDNVYAMKKYYSFVVVVDDPSGATDIEKVYLQGKNGGAVLWEVRATDLTGAGSWDIQSGATIMDLDAGSCTFGEAGDVGTATFKVRTEWDHNNLADLELSVYVEDAGAQSAGWTVMQTDYWDAINRTVTYNFAANVSGVSVNTPIELSGLVRYATTVGGDLASSSYPPDAQFTSVQIENDESEIVGTDAAIVNGAFSASFNSSAVPRTTTYYVYLDLLADYVDGLAPDGDAVYVTTTPPFYLSDLIEDAFETFGVLEYLSNATAYGTALGAYFFDSITNIVQLITQQFLLVLGIFDFFIDWYTRMVSLVISIGDAITGLLDGTGTVTTGLGNIWDFISLSTWIDIVPVFLFIWWVESIATRGERQGEITVFFGDLSTIFNVTSWLMSMFGLIINTVTDLAFRLLGVIT